ncbi:MAG TPA: hypothetical protein VGL33_33320 [Streptosporangiaceae bacterium]
MQWRRQLPAVHLRTSGRKVMPASGQSGDHVNPATAEVDAAVPLGGRRRRRRRGPAPPTRHSTGAALPEAAAWTRYYAGEVAGSPSRTASWVTRCRSPTA